MKISISTDYATQILCYLHDREDRLYTTTHISGAIGITYPFCVKLTTQLKKKGLLHSEQGRNGGYRLGRPAHEISLYDVYQCIEGEMQISRCFEREDKPCNHKHTEHCKFRNFLRNLQDDLIIAPMTQMMISDLTRPDEARRPSDEKSQGLQRHYAKTKVS